MNRLELRIIYVLLYVIGTIIENLRLDIKNYHKEQVSYTLKYSTARFKLYAREYILTSINTFSASSQPLLTSKGSMLTSMGCMLASMGSMLSSKGKKLSCMVLLAI